MDKRVSTALIAVRDTLVALVISAPLAVPVIVMIWARAPEPDPEVNRAIQVFDAVGWLLPVLLITGNLGFLIAGWWFRRRRPVPDWEAQGRHELTWLQAIPVGILVGFGALLLGAIFAALILLPLGVETPEDELMTALAGSSGLVLAVVVVLGTVVAPIGEELFFRGHLFRWSASRCGLTYAYGLTATIFAVGHGNPYGLPYYLIIGLVLAWSYQRWRNLAVPIIAHATVNAIALTMLVTAVRAAGRG